MNKAKVRELRTQLLKGMDFKPVEGETLRDVKKYPEVIRSLRVLKREFNRKRNEQHPKFKPTKKQRRILKLLENKNKHASRIDKKVNRELAGI